MTGPFQGQSMAQFLREATKGTAYNTELSRAFVGFEIPMKEVAKRLGRGVRVKASEDNDAMDEEVSEEEASSTSEASSLSCAASLSGEEAASRKRPGSHDETKKKKKPKKKGQQSIFSFFRSAEKKEG